MTNFEKIKSMDIDEMENFLCGLCADTIITSLGGPPTKSPNKKKNLGQYPIKTIVMVTTVKTIERMML